MTTVHGNLLTRLFRGSRWSWRDARHASALPADLESTVMSLESLDLHHAKQGRSTARVRFDRGPATLSVFLKRHYQLPWRNRLAALVHPSGHHSPASAEWAHLERARRLGIAVPEVVAVGEWVGPWGALRSYLMVAELVGHSPLHEAIPELSQTLDLVQFARLKRAIVIEMAEIAAKLHRSNAFHKDLYLCHFFLDRTAEGDVPEPLEPKLCLIDLHRLAIHRWTAPRWRVKDLGQLLFSTEGVAGIDDRDRLRFWKHYRRLLKVRLPKLQRRLVQTKATLYLAHNR